MITLLNVTPVHQGRVYAGYMGHQKDLNFDIPHSLNQGSPNCSAQEPHQLLNNRWGKQKRSKTAVLLLIIYVILFYSVTIYYNVQLSG